MCAADQYALQHEASSDHDMHDATWTPHDSQPYGNSGDHGVSTAGHHLDCDASSNTPQSSTSRPRLAIAIGEKELLLCLMHIQREHLAYTGEQIPVKQSTENYHDTMLTGILADGAVSIEWGMQT